MELIKMTYNGVEIETEAGKPLIDLSRELGEEIPHFCYHPGLGPEGSCRLCLVEVAKIPKLVPACTLTTSAGMEVIANSEKVIKARKGVLEFLLINHPLDCPICDKGGECPLQDNTRLHGPGHSRMEDDKNLNFKHRIIGERIIHDAERCILCTRCVRFQRDVVGNCELTIKNRGDKATVDLFSGSRLTGNFTGNLADICPVGALTSRDFRFKARPWELEQVESVCGVCSMACSASTWWLGDQLARLTASPDSAVNSWWLCDRGRYGRPSENGSAGNLVRLQGEQVPMSREETAARALEIIRQGAGSCAVLCGSRSTNEELASLTELNGFLDSPFSPFAGASTEPRRFLAALDEEKLELNDLARLGGFDRAIILGRDPLETHPVLALRLGEAAANGLAVTLVGEQPGPDPEGFTQEWSRSSETPESWLQGQGSSAMTGSDRLLLIVDEMLLRSGRLDTSILDLCRGREGEFSVVLLTDGFNRRGLMAAAGDREDDNDALLKALEEGRIDHLFLFGVEAQVDFKDHEQWVRALSQNGSLIVQCRDMKELHRAAEVVLARRPTLALAGSMINTLGLTRRLTARSALRCEDYQWWLPLLSGESAGKAVGNEG
ncbi:MAG: 2Fe-2S iron-sulfur cluster binding domain-containing protein [bacterium]|nr:2Fe-2S iron-sulfur cluster binding domain-containing protein [bacterium]